MSRAHNNKQLDDFSLVLGGPLFQFFIRARISTDTLGLLKRRLIVISLFTWLPLLLLSLLPGEPTGNAIKVPFLYDIEVHIRFLLALPLMLLAELVVHNQLRPLIRQFVERGIVVSEGLPQFEAIIGSALRLRNSVMMEVLLIALVLTVGHYLWSSQMALGADTWFSVLVDGSHRFSPAGLWYAYVSIPFFQFMLVRWYFRIFIWARFLWQVSRMKLHLEPTHPDRSGGLGFLADGIDAFIPLLLAQGALLAGLIADRIFYEEETLLDFKPEIAAALIFALLLMLAPLCVFVSRLIQSKEEGLLEYGALASRYVCEFEQKWLRGAPPEDEPLVGTRDIQSLNDLAGGFEVVRGMRLFPFGKEAVLKTAVLVLLPVLPLALTLISLNDLVKRLVDILL
ncbi:hypothetical protein [Methylobacter sp.]|uniref:hypothetical protein n=1 Tax=Methylobacter sp. TaxID=2051955 RepID=UPI0011F810D4|nr:hypothetical protein [Methylobacter sp.]TAK62711.1 MAG: hypothetical protein EPO18_09585 [Methylobacter sp.]